MLVEPVPELNAVLIRVGERPDVLERRLADGLYTNEVGEGGWEFGTCAGGDGM